MAINAKDINGVNFGVGAYVSVRCLVTAITAAAGSTHAGSGDPVTVTVLTPGNVGERAGVSFTISGVQCERAVAPSQVSGN